MNQTSKLSKPELAQRLGVSPRQVDILVSRQELPAGTRLGRHLYWADAVADKWEARQFAEQLNWARASC